MVAALNEKRKHAADLIEALLALYEQVEPQEPEVRMGTGKAAAQPEVRMGTGSESAHWYAPGDPVQCAYEILGANGKWRNVNMRDARKYGWLPGVSSITRIETAPGLERFKRKQIMYAALTHPEVENIKDHNELFRVLEKDGAAQVKKAAEDGTAIHKAVETYIQTGLVDTDYAEHITAARKALAELIGVDDRTKWTVETAAIHPYGVGGRSDCHSSEFNIVVDFKSREFAPGQKLDIYPNQGQQLAAYREMLGLPSARAVNVYLSRNHPGECQVHEWDQDKLAKHWREFRALLQFWQIKNNFPELSEV